MIKYSLICDKEHEFEAWFASSDDFTKQQKRGLVGCPHCNSNQVQKALMTPGVSGTRKQDIVPQQAQPMMAQLPKEVIGKLKELRRFVENNAENVGEKLPEEARKIHYGEAEPRGIFGKASIEEAVSLAEEGIDLVPVPELPEDKN